MSSDLRRQIKTKVAEQLASTESERQAANVELHGYLSKKGVDYDGLKRTFRVNKETEVLDAELKARKELGLPKTFNVATVVNKLAENEQRDVLEPARVGTKKERERAIKRNKEKALEWRNKVRAEKIRQHKLVFGEDAPLEFTEKNDGLTAAQRNLAMTTKERNDKEKAKAKADQEEFARLKREYFKGMSDEKKSTVRQINTHQVQQQIAWRKETKGMLPSDVKKWHEVRRDQQTRRIYQMVMYQSGTFFNLASVAYEQGIPTLTPDGKRGAPRTAPKTRCVIEIAVPSESTFHFSRKWIPEITWFSIDEIEARYDRQVKIFRGKDADGVIGPAPPAWEVGTKPTNNVEYFASILHDLRTYDPADSFVFNIIKRNDSYDDALDSMPNPNFIHGVVKNNAEQFGHNIAEYGPLKICPPICANPVCGWFLIAGCPLRCDQRCVESAYEVFCDVSCRDNHYENKHKDHWEAIKANRTAKKGKDKAKKQAQRLRQKERERIKREAMRANPALRNVFNSEDGVRRATERSNRKLAVEKLDAAKPDYWLESTSLLRTEN